MASAAPLPIVFFGTAELARASLAALALAPFARLIAVVTQPARPKGRDLQLHPSPVKTLALDRGLPVLQPLKARDPGFLETLRGFAPELIVVAAYGQILPASILQLPLHGCVNVHASLLPKYRGAAPIQWALIDGETVSGVTLMRMDEGLDTGDILTQESTPIRDDDTAQSLHDRLAALGADLLVRTLPDYVAGRIVPQPQPSVGATYARKILKTDGAIDWTLPARALWFRVRGLTPWPGAFTWLPGTPAPVRLKVWQSTVASGRAGVPGTVLEAGAEGIVVACGDAALRLTVVQREGGRRLAAPEFLAGHPLAPGTQLGGGSEPRP